jgi:hypothetical protein
MASTMGDFIASLGRSVEYDSGKHYIGFRRRERLEAGGPGSRTMQRAVRVSTLLSIRSKTGKNVGSFKHRSGSWVKGKGGRFIGAR